MSGAFLHYTLHCHVLNIHIQRQLYAHHCLWIMITQTIEWLVTDWIIGVQCPVWASFFAPPAPTHILQGPTNLPSRSNKWSFSGFFEVQPTRYNVLQYSLLLSMLYMFWAVSPPIIRSSKTVHTASGTCQDCLLSPLAVAAASLAHTRCCVCVCVCVYSFWAPDDGRRNRPKHVEHWQ
jgi:hypothetical protein